MVNVMLMLRLPDGLEKRLEKLAACTQRTKSFYAREAILMSLDVLEEKYMNENKTLKNNSKSFYDLLVDEFSLPVKLVTEARKSPFTMFSKDGKLFVHNSKDNIRPLDEGPANGFYKIFKETGSITPVSYRDVTFNSSYFLAAVHHLKEKGVL